MLTSASVQVVVISCCLVLAGCSKIAARHEAGQTLLAMSWRRLPIGNRNGLTALWWIVICVEILLGVAILLPSSRTPALVGSAVFFGCATATAAWGRRAAPNAPCGCFGASSPNSLWTVVRSSWLLFSALTCLAILHGAPTWARPAIPLYILVIAVNAAVFGLCSDFVRTRGGRAARAVRCARVRRVWGAAKRGEAFEHVAGTAYWRKLVERGVLSSLVPSRIWRQSGWIMMDFPGTLDGMAVRVVAAVRAGYQPPLCRIVLIDPSSKPFSLRASWEALGKSEASVTSPFSGRLSTQSGRMMASETSRP